MIGYLALRSARGVVRSPHGFAVVLTLAVGLAITFWYVALPVMAVIGVCAYAYRRHVLAENAAKRQVVVDAETLASARAHADRKGIPHQSVYSRL